MAKVNQVVPINDHMTSWQLELLRLVTQKSIQLALPVYLVGGFVRDLVMGLSGSDLDIVVEGDATVLARALIRDNGGKATYHPRFKTATLDVSGWKFSINGSTNDPFPMGSTAVDLISARSETYKKPAVLPTIKFGSILDDLHRRDFSINAMAIRLDGEARGKLIDPLDGLGDVKQGVVRTLHENSFVDDPTRIYRAVRYEQRFQFNIAHQTLSLIPDASKYINELSGERIRNELDLILGEPKCIEMLARLGELGLLSLIQPSLRWDQSTSARFRNLHHPANIETTIDSIHRIRWILWQLTSSEEEVISLATRLQFDGGLKKSMLSAARLWTMIPGMKDFKPSQWVGVLEQMPVLAVNAVRLAAPSMEIDAVLKKYLKEWRFIKPLTDGNKLKKLGVLPGEEFHTILENLRAAWLDGRISSPDEEEALLQTLIK